MKKADRVSKHYFEDKARFADLLNGVIFDGKEILQADDIHERKREVTFPKGNNENTEYIEVTRDIVNEVAVCATVIMVAIENQNAIHYAMPVRVMAGDCGSYHEQWRETAQIHKEKKDLKGAEFLSGFSKDDRLMPSITVVVYLGERPWDGPRTLHDLLDMETLPEELRKYVADYPMFLLEVGSYKDLEKFKTDIQYVFGYLQNRSDKEKLKKYIEENREYFKHMQEDAFEFMTNVSNSKELKRLKTKYENPKGEVDMCKAIQDMILDSWEDGKQEGRKEGRKEGKSEGIL